MPGKSRLITLEDGKWILGGKKHPGENLADVASEDPGYLAWVFREVYDDLTLEAQRALDEAIEEYDIKI